MRTCLSVVCSLFWLTVAGWSADIITDTAGVSSEPAVDLGQLRLLGDGLLKSGLAFPVGSSGEGAVIFRFFRPREVSGLRFYQNSDVYYSTAFRIAADCDGDGTFEQLLAEGACSGPYQWSGANWSPVILRALRLESVEGVSKGRRAHPCLSEVEVLGKALPTDAEDRRRGGWPIREISTVRPVDRWTDLSGKARPVAVLHPVGEAGRRAANRVAEALRAKGATRILVTADPSRARPDRHHVIALGSVNDNELIARLYWNAYAYEDARVPGPGGWTVRTVFDPYPWHGQGNAIVAGYSREADAGRAAAALLDAVEFRNGSPGMGYRLQVSSAGAVSPAAVKRLAAATAPSFHVFLTSAEQYLRTGAAEYAEHAVATLERIVDAQQDNEDYQCDWPEETRSGRIMAVWDAFEEHPLIDDARRLRFSRAVLRFMRTLPRRVSGYGDLEKSKLVTWNHTTFPLLGLYFGSRYFQDYYQLSEAETHLAKAKACFLAQARSWKPQEDADSYMTLTLNHTLDYCLAEWRVDLLRSTGVVGGFADYVIGFCDSAGLAAGFGDSGLHRSPSLLANVLPRAFWFTRDPGYAWILAHTQGSSWRNPFHPEVKPVEPAEHVGMRVFPLDGQLYEFTSRHRFYNEPFVKPNVPADRAFDKIAFRESWDQAGQYFLLDGFSRGKHLHYDGNAIIEYVDRGRTWLIDHDYLTRNTTEHNMLSVLRKGRADRLQPPCAGLVCSADSGGRTGLATTEVRDYLGVDWRRSLFWLKGEYLAVLDRVTAREGDAYDLDLTWKVEDKGDERLLAGSPGGTFVVRRSTVSGRNRGASVIDDEHASGGKALLLGESGAEFCFVVDLPAAVRRVAVYAYGQDGSSDSVFVTVAGSPPVACHLPKASYGPSNARFDHSGGLSVIAAPAAGRRMVSVRLREKPPVRIDRVVFYDGGGRELLSVEAEDAPPPSAAERTGLVADRFFLKWDDPLSVRTVASAPKGMIVPVRKLFQRRSGRLDAGESAEFANLLYCDSTADGIEYTIRRIAPGAVLIDGTEPALLAVAGARVPGLEFDAQMVMIGPTQVAWCGGRSLRFGTCRIQSEAVGSAEVTVATGRVLGDGNPTATGLTREAVTAWLAGLRTSGAVSEETEETLPATPPVWTHSFEGGAVRRLRIVDLDGDGRSEIVAAAGNAALALDRNGNRRWRYDLPAPCEDVAVGDLLKARAGTEVVVAGKDAFAYLLDFRGALLSKKEMRGPVWNQKHGDRPWACTSVECLDLDQDGTPEIVLGTESMELRIYDSAWNRLALVRQAVLHGSMDFQGVDVDGDGRLELLATNRYGSVTVHAADGKRLGQFYTSIGDMQAVAADLDGDGRLELAAGSSTGDLICWRLPARGPLREAEIAWRFDNFGYGVNRMRATDLDGDGTPEIVVASQTGYVYALTGAGRLLWQVRAGGDVVELVILPERRLLAVDRSGAARVIGPDGVPLQQLNFGFTPTRAALCGNLIVAGGAGRIAAFALP